MAARKWLPWSPIEKDPNRALIERALAMGIAMSQIGRRYGHTVTAISRYRDRMPPQLKAAIVGPRVRRLFYRAGSARSADFKQTRVVLITAPRCTITAMLGLATKLLVPDEGERGTGRALRYAWGSASARRPTPTAVAFLNGIKSDISIWWTQMSQRLRDSSRSTGDLALELFTSRHGRYSWTK